MNNNLQQINFKENRDFGQVFNTTFAFIKQNFKPLFKAILSFVLPFAFIYGIVQGMMQMDMFSFLDRSYMYDTRSASDVFSKMLMYYGLLILFAGISYTMLVATVYSYICLYIEKGLNNFSAGDVWEKIKSIFFKTLGANFLFILVVGAATMILFFTIGLSGLYMATSLSFMFIIAIFERKNVGEAFSRSFKLTHKRFWWTLLLLITLTIMIAIVNMVFGIPNMIITFSISFNQGGSETMKYVQAALTIVSSIVGIILYSIPLIALAFQYFSIVEEHEGKGLEERINMINNN